MTAASECTLRIANSQPLQPLPQLLAGSVYSCGVARHAGLPVGGVRVFLVTVFLGPVGVVECYADSCGCQFAYREQIAGLAKG